MKMMKSRHTLILQDIDTEAILERFVELYPNEANVYFLSKGDDKKMDSPSTLSNINGDYLQRAIELKRSLFAAEYRAHNQAFADDIVDENKQVFISEYSPMIILALSKEQIDFLSKDENVCGLDLFINEDCHDCIEVANSISKADYVRDSEGFDGSGIKIGQLESGVPQDNSDLLNVNKLSTDSQTAHATLVALIMVGQSNGIAPGAILYSRAMSSLSGFYRKVEDLLSLGVNIINVSAGFASDGQYGTSSKWVDHIAKQHDVHIVFASGNYDKFVNPDYYVSNVGMAYNAFTVGCFDDKNIVEPSNEGEEHSICDYSAYEEWYNINRAEKPNVIASGENIYYPGFGSNSGTSFAAPQVSGVIAQMCQRDTMLKTRQSVMGALLAAGAVAIDQSNDPLIANTQQIREKQGAGMLNARNMLEIIDSGIYLRYKRAAENFPITRTVSISTLQQTTVRAAIFWLKQNSLSGNHSSGFSINEEPLSNLDLKIYDPNGTAIALSTTQYSNYEIVEFSPTVSGTYTIKITRSASATAAEEIVGLAFIQSVD